jgi:thiol-disulfide isomerase/thioredoxin
MNLRVLSVPALILLAGGLAGCAGASSGKDSAPAGDSRYVAGSGVSQVIKDRKPAPAIKGTTVQGQPLNLASYKGKVVVVNFWASWCAPCRAEAPTLQKVSEETKASGVQFVGVDIKDGKDNAAAFQRTFKTTYPSLFDQAGQIALSFRDVPPNAVPSTLVIDRQGRIAARAIGSISYSPLRDIVTKLAAEK